MGSSMAKGLSRRRFCLCCAGGAAFAATGGWLTPRQAFAEARGIVSLIQDSAAVSPIVTHPLRNGISVLEGSGGNIAVLTGPDGKILIGAGIGVSRPQITKALADLGAEPITYLVNTHWHFDHADGNEWLHSVGATIIAQENTRKYLSEIQRVEDWDYNFLPSAPGAILTEVFASERSLVLNGASIGMKRYRPAHTDSDISVTFAEADILHTGEPGGDHGRDDHHSRSRAPGQQPGGATGIPRHARSHPGQRRDAQEAGKIARRDRRGHADSRLRRRMGQVRDRSRLLHEAGLRGRLSAEALALSLVWNPQDCDLTSPT